MRAADDAIRSETAHGYRPHLDGIRALAVVAVILFHLGYGWIPGGFVGVDVFFVLSGYLITGILLREVDGRGTLRLSRFYARRARRLLPASIAVIAVVLVLSAQLLDAVQQQSVGWDAVYAALYSANWRFALVGGDYFAPGDVPSPLVHYWSLAVEEQFYLVWPALLLGLHALGRRLRPRDPLPVVLSAVAGLALASAVASIALAGSPLTYYGTHTRAYQLLAGGILAIGVGRWRWRLPDGRSGQVAGGTLAAAGLAVLAYLAHDISDATQYPGWPGMWVTVASLAVIAGVDLAPAGGAQAVIGHRSLAAVGRLSYSLYIWHWPVIVLLPVAAEHWGGPLDRLTGTAGLAAVTVAIALASYLLVERPIRFRLAPSLRPLPVVAVGLSCSVLMATVAYARFQPDSAFERQALDAVRDLAKPGSCTYFAEDWPAPADSEPCVYRQGTGPVVALVGDSHGQQWQPALEELAIPDDATIVRATRGGCPANDVTAFLRDETRQFRVERDCTEWRHVVYRKLIDEYDPDVVIVGTRSFVRGLEVDGSYVYQGGPVHLAAWTDGWDWTLDTLTSGGATVVVNQLLPTLPERIPACLVEHGEGTTDCDFPVSVDQRVIPYQAAVTALDGTHDGQVRVVDPTSFACPGGTCPAIIDDVIVHRDDNHLSATFVRRHAADYAALLDAVGVTI
ncbi:MAG: acyltransferase [Actinobacteria bacterium]|nr:acyltransferase [Actinomycetota bacterium]